MTCGVKKTARLWSFLNSAGILHADVQTGNVFWLKVDYGGSDSTY